MHLLITGGDSRLARAVIAALPEETRVRLLDTRFTASFPGLPDAREGDLRDREFVTAALEGVDTVLHLAPLFPPVSDELEVLDLATRGTYVLTTAAAEAGVQRFVVGSTLALFDRLPAHWKVEERWRPRPEPRLEQLAPWLAELSVRECARVNDLHAFCLRFGQIVDAADAAAQPYDPRWLHLDDAVAGVQCALMAPFREKKHRDWRIYHITAAGERAKIRLAGATWDGFGYEPKHDFQERWAVERGARDTRPWQEVLSPPEPIASRPIRRVVVFGAGGPVAAELAQELKDSYTLRLTDVRALADVLAEGNRQSPNAPLPAVLDAPHECRVVDVRNAGQVLAACEGMDAVVNTTVVRPDPVEAFRVNTLGAYNVMRAAVAHGIRRVVQTGPELVTIQGEADYRWDYDIPGNPPMRPGDNLYGHSKYLGQEICRVFAEYYGLEVPVLLYSQFLDPEKDRYLHPMAVSWRDSARAIRCALEVATLPSPYEVVHILTDMPHGKFNNRQAKELLDWEPQDLVDRFWQDEAS